MSTTVAFGFVSLCPSLSFERGLDIENVTTYRNSIYSRIQGTKSHCSSGSATPKEEKVGFGDGLAIFTFTLTSEQNKGHRFKRKANSNFRRLMSHPANYLATSQFPKNG